MGVVFSTTEGTAAEQGIQAGTAYATFPWKVYADVIEQDNYWAHDNVLQMFCRFTGIPMEVITSQLYQGVLRKFPPYTYDYNSEAPRFYVPDLPLALGHGHGHFTIQNDGQHYELEKHTTTLPDFGDFETKFAHELRRRYSDQLTGGGSGSA